jgi:hypothetical protein
MAQEGAGKGRGQVREQKTQVFKLQHASFLSDTEGQKLFSKAHQDPAIRWHLAKAFSHEAWNLRWHMGMRYADLDPLFLKSW